MSYKRGRVIASVVTACLLVFMFAGVASANVASKTIMTTNGDCVNSGNPPTLADGTTPCGAAVYGTNGFTGTITFASAEIGTTVTVVDYICSHTTGAAAFVSYGGAYTFTASSGGTPLATSSYTVASGTACTDGNFPAITGSGATFIVPSSGVIDYSVSISGVTSANAQSTFSSFNAILNRAFEPANGSHANSPSVAPPGPSQEVPEAPFAALLLLTGGGLAGAYVWLRGRKDPTIATAA